MLKGVARPSFLSQCSFWRFRIFCPSSDHCCQSIWRSLCQSYIKIRLLMGIWLLNKPCGIFHSFTNQRLLNPENFWHYFLCFLCQNGNNHKWTVVHEYCYAVFLSRYLNISHLLRVVPQAQKSQEAIKLVPEFPQNLVRRWSAQLPCQPDSQSYCRKKKKPSCMPG